MRHQMKRKNANYFDGTTTVHSFYDRSSSCGNIILLRLKLNYCCNWEETIYSRKIQVYYQNECFQAFLIKRQRKANQLMSQVARRLSPNSNAVDLPHVAELLNWTVEVQAGGHWTTESPCAAKQKKICCLFWSHEPKGTDWLYLPIIKTQVASLTWQQSRWVTSEAHKNLVVDLQIRKWIPWSVLLHPHT